MSQRARLTDPKPIPPAIEADLKLCTTDGILLSNPTLQHQVFGSLVYLTISISDIGYAIHVVSQFVAHPIFIHWVTVLLNPTIFTSNYQSCFTSVIPQFFCSAWVFLTRIGVMMLMTANQRWELLTQFFTHILERQGKEVAYNSSAEALSNFGPHN